MKKEKGFTLVETLLIIGIISLATIGIYTIFNIASDWNKASNEANGLHNAINRIERATNTSGNFSGITMNTLPIVGGGFSSFINMNDIVSPSPSVLNFVYRNVNGRICSNFVSKMLGVPGNVSATLNGVAVPNMSESSDIASKCATDSNDVTITLSSNVSVAGLGAVTPDAASTIPDTSSTTPSALPPSWMSGPLVLDGLSPDVAYRAAHPIVTPWYYSNAIYWIWGGGYLFGGGQLTQKSDVRGYAEYQLGIWGITYDESLFSIYSTPVCRPGDVPAKKADGSLATPAGCQAA